MGLKKLKTGHSNQTSKPRLLWASVHCLLDTSSGVSIQVCEMLRQLVRSGYEVTILTASVFDEEIGVSNSEELRKAIESNKRSVVTLQDDHLLHKVLITESMKRASMTSEEEAIWYSFYIEILKKFDPDIVWFYGGHTLDFLIPDEARSRGIATAAYVANANYVANKRWMRDVDLCITDSHATSGLYEEQLGIKAIPVGAFINPAAVIAYEKTPINALLVNPSLAKGGAIFIQLAFLLWKKRPDISFEVVESRGKLDELVSLVTTALGETHQSLPNISVTPITDDMRPVYARAKVLIAPSLRWESFGRVAAEAMINGIPAIVTNRGGLPEVIGSGGVVIDFPDEYYTHPYLKIPPAEMLQPIVELIERFYDDPVYYRLYSQKAFEQGKKHRMSLATGRLLKAVDSLLPKTRNSALNESDPTNTRGPIPQTNLPGEVDQTDDVRPEQRSTTGIPQSDAIPTKLQIDRLLEHYQTGNVTEAKSLAIQLTEEFPGHQFAWKVLGAVLKKIGQLKESVGSMQKAVDLEPLDAEAHSNLGITLKQLGRLDEAEATCRRAIELKPDYAEAYSNLGVTLQGLGRLHEARDCLATAIRLKPDFAQAHYNMGVTLQELNETENSIVCYNTAISLNPDYVKAYYNLATALKDIDRLEESVSCLRRAIAIDPNVPEAYCSLGLRMHELGLMEAAIHNFSQAIHLNPEYTDARYNLGFSMQLHGNLRDGFEAAESRLAGDKPKARPPRVHLSWDGERSLDGKKFLVYEEQGLGDIIQFSRYLLLLIHKGANVSFRVQSKLHHLLSSLHPAINFISSDAECAAPDFECPLLSLPYFFQTKLENVPAPIPYLSVDPIYHAKWVKKISPDSFNIGICWHGSTGKGGTERSFPLSLFEDIAGLPGVNLISLHKGQGESQIASINFDLTTFGDEFDGGDHAFLDTAAVMAQCDLIITSDTAIAHLAGAIGRPTWVVLKQIPDWRWMLDRADSPWYPTMTLYRQTERGNWISAFERVKEDLEILLKERGY